MAKNSFPSFKTGGGILKKVVIAAVVLAIIVMVLKSPGESAGIVNDARDGGEGVIDSLITFFRSLRSS